MLWRCFDDSDRLKINISGWVATFKNNTVLLLNTLIFCDYLVPSLVLSVDLKLRKPKERLCLLRHSRKLRILDSESLKAQICAENTQKTVVTLPPRHQTINL